jgi:hypothetical protein
LPFPITAGTWICFKHRVPQTSCCATTMHKRGEAVQTKRGPCKGHLLEVGQGAQKLPLEIIGSLVVVRDNASTVPDDLKPIWYWTIILLFVKELNPCSVLLCFYEAREIFLL